MTISCSSIQCSSTYRKISIRRLDFTSFILKVLNIHPLALNFAEKVFCEVVHAIANALVIVQLRKAVRKGKREKHKFEVLTPHEGVEI